MAEAGHTARSTEGTVVFTDIVGFTEFTALRGDDEANALLSKQERLVRSVLPPKARIVKELGDGLLLWFEDACDALTTTLRLQQLYEESADSDMPLWVRAGVHSGRHAYRGDDLIGPDVTVASRVAGDASLLYARNLLNFLTPLVDQQTGALDIDWDDEIIKGTGLTRDGAVVHPQSREGEA